MYTCLGSTSKQDPKHSSNLLKSPRISSELPIFPNSFFPKNPSPKCQKKKKKEKKRKEKTENEHWKGIGHET